MDPLARNSRRLLLLCLLCICGAAHGQSNSVSVNLTSLIIQGEINQAFENVSSRVKPAPAYTFSITGNVHGEGPVYSVLVPSSEPAATAFESIHKGLSAALQGNVPNPGAQFPATILSEQLSSGTDGAFNALFTVSLDNTGGVNFVVSNVAIKQDGQPDTTDRLVFDSGELTITTLYADVNAVTLSATDIGTNSATLQSSILCPNPFQAYFVYSTDMSFSGSSSAVSLAASGTAQFVSIPVTGLLAHRLYRYKAAGADVTGPSYGAVRTFTTEDHSPVSGTFTAFAGVTPMAIPVLSRCSDIDGDALSVTSVSTGTAGFPTVAANRKAVTYRFVSALIPADQFTYTISDGFGGSATGTVNVLNYGVMAGTYSAVLLNPASQNAGSGFLRVSLTATGRCTGSLTVGGVTLPFTGVLDSSGQLTMTLNTAGPFGTAVTLNMAQAGNGYVINAGVAMNGMRLVAALRPAVRSAPGIYTLLMPPSKGASYAGSGYAQIKIGSTGLAAIAGTLPDGAPFSCMAAVDGTGGAGIFCPLYAVSNPGSLSGALSITGSGTAVISGTLVWVKPAFSSAGINQGPFSIVLTGSGGRYVPPAGGAALQFGSLNNIGHVVASAGNLNTPIQNELSISLSSHVTILGPASDGLALTLQPASGLFTGHFTDPLNGATRTIRGALLQPSQAGGYFLGDSISGSIGIGP